MHMLCTWKEGFFSKRTGQRRVQEQDSSLDGGMSILHDGNAQLPLAQACGPNHFTVLGTAATMWTSPMPASFQHQLPDSGQETGT